MIITYFRSSSFNTHCHCEMQYFGEYVLGWKGPSGLKADKGTIVHKVLEILAIIKFAQQNNQTSINDDIVGKISTKRYNLDKIINIVYDHYSGANPHHKWIDKDRADCYNWVYKAIEFNDGMFDPRNKHIVCPEQQFDFEINKPWAKYSYDTPNGKIKGNLALKGTIDLITKVDDNFLEIVDWKGLPLDTLIPTPSGWTTMKDIKVGDMVFDQCGHRCNVVGKSQVKTKDCYKITFDDKTSVICDDEHLWKLSDGNVVPVTQLVCGNKINVCKPLVCEDIELPIEPYLLGVWLGDGRNRNCEISCNDIEIFDELSRRGHSLAKIRNDNHSNTKYVTVLETTNKLRNLNLLNNKHIPKIYFRASFKQRLDLLRGLLDTDGNVNTIRKQAVFTNCNKKLSDDVKELLLTLGQRPNQSVINRDTNFKKNITIYPVCFRPIDINPFLLSRKADRIDPSWGCGKSNKRTIKNIQRSIIQQTQCISVDSPDNTYLCTENLIPTHNTGRRLNWSTGEEKTPEKLQKDPQLMIYHYAAHHLYPDIDHIMITINYINDGGPFSILFEKKDLIETETMLKEKFEQIKKTSQPKLNRTWQCNKLCYFGKSSFEDTNIPAIKEYRQNQVTPINQIMTKCEQLKHDISVKGMDVVVEEYTKPNFSIGSYKAPGSVE